MDVIKLLQKRAEEFPSKPAVIARGNPVTFSQLRDTVFKLADSLEKLGVKKGDAVAIYLPGCPEYMYSYLAVWCLGAVAVPLDYMLTGDELISCLGHSEAVLLIARPKPIVSFDTIKSQSPALKDIVVCQAHESSLPLFESLLEHGTPALRVSSVSERDRAIIFYTSGTTGKPKGVIINYRQLGAPPESMGFFVGDLSSQDVALCALPFSHLGGLIYILNCIAFGMTFVLMERFVPAEFLKNIQQYKVTCFWIVPSMYYAFLQLKEFESIGLSSLRWMVTFGASNSPDALRRFQQYCPKAHLLNGWGLTETNAPTTVIPRGSNKIESVGRPAPWIDVKIFDDADKPLPAGSVGEVVVKSWVVTQGYFKDPELTAETIKNGWFHTGDLGRLDAEGLLYIVGRKKEMIKVSGEIVFEPEVEAAIHKHPAIAEVAVIGVPDTLRGEIPKAFIVVKPQENTDGEDLRQFCRQHLAHFKVPHYFEFVTELPKNRTGKIDKELLRRKGL
ncbi:MAG TPA: AMP-binding protein [Candidatus Omnitrophota bacterium]|nr:AMP-binding protein [Candidatus Omnitrophota bacterium]HPT07055.1 AMP-binding protein [Candidatus Omnitrophota bacterium]